MRPSQMAFVGLIVSAAFAYAVVRYVVLGDTTADHIPLYVANKATAVTAIVLLGLSIGLRDAGARRTMGLSGFVAAGVHLVLSLPLLGPSYFPTLYLDEGGSRLTALAELAFLAGGLALALVVALAWPRLSGRITPHAVATSAVALVAVHAVALGWPAWWRPDAWPGGLPPLTLMSCAFALLSLLFALRAR